MLNKTFHFLAIAVIVLYLVISFIVVKDYGITWDEPVNFEIGHKYLHYYITGELNLADDAPKIEGHPNFYVDAVTYFPATQKFGAVANTLSAVTCYIFYQRFHLLDPIPAHHIVVPILVAIFLYILFSFVRRYWGSFVAFLSVASLISYPRFFGHSFNNIKDVPQMVFSSLTIMVFVNWWFTKRIKYLYFTFILFGIALATKVDAVFAPVILILWLTPVFIQKLRRNDLLKIRTLAHMTAGGVIVALLFIVSYPPLLKMNKVNFLYSMLSWYSNVAAAPNISWNLYAPLQISYVTPVIMLCLFAAGFIWISCNDITKNRTNFLLLIWFAFPVLRQCFPHVNHYDGIRHFLIFLVPFTIITSIGAEKVAGYLTNYTKIKRTISTGLLCIIILLPNVYSIVSAHPYQTTYFNCLIGGLKGAQNRGVPFSCDYWLNSYREAGEWLEKNAKSDAKFCAYPSKNLSYYISRKDLISIPPESIFQDNTSNVYFVLIPRTWWPKMIFLDISKFLSKLEEYEVVYQIKRQEGEIVTIYHKP